MNFNDAVDKLYTSEEINKPVKLYTMSEADKMSRMTFRPFEYDTRSNFSKGLEIGVGELTDIPQEITLFGKRANLAIGGYFGDTPEELENKRINLITAERNLLETKRNRMQQNKVTKELPGEWQLWLTKDYIAELYDRLRPGIKSLDKKTIRTILKSFRDEKAFSIRTGRREQKYLRKQGFTTWLMWNLFQKRQFMLLYRLIYLKNRK